MRTQPDPLPEDLGQLVDTWEEMNQQLVDTWEEMNQRLNIVIGVLTAVGFGLIGFALCLLRNTP